MESLTSAQQELYDWLVEYIHKNQYSPSIRQMMHAMELKSPAPVQSRLEHLREKGYIDWIDGQARTIRIVKTTPSGLPVRGVITAGGAFDPVTDVEEYIDLSLSALTPNDYALRVQGDSMIDAHIVEGDLVIMRPVKDPQLVKNGTIVAAYIEGEKRGTTLKHFHRRGNQVTLKPANPNHKPIKASAEDVTIQGVLVGVWRSP